MNRTQGNSNGTRETAPRLLAELCTTPMEPDLFLPLAISLAEAVAGLHAERRIHGRISPGTILVDKNGAATLAGSLPTGTAAYRDPEELDPPYMSPEQTGRMSRPVDQRSDLYSLGVTLYRMLTAALPFDAQSVTEWVHCHLARPPRHPGEYSDRIAPVLAQIVLKLLHKNGEDRYQSAAGLKADLEKCLARWRSFGEIAPFPLGEQDVPERLLLPQKLYGREKEVSALCQVFDRVVQHGSSEMVTVAGPSGIGKTSLVGELYRHVARSRGLFLSGKYDPLKKGSPYSAISEAVTPFVTHLLTEREEEVARWRGALLAALGGNARLMVEVIPELELVIGAQPTVQQLPPAESRNRFILACEELIGVLAGEEHPLVLFLDDLQWVDPATVTVLEQLILNRGLKYLLLVGAYRENDVDSLHPLSGALERIRRGGLHFTGITLPPLSLAAVRSYLNAALCPAEAGGCAELARLVHEKTGGTPFYMPHFLSELYQQGLLTFCREDRRWSWDPEGISRKGCTEEVADLVAGKLEQLPAETLAVISAAACVGKRVSVPFLAKVRGLSERAAAAILQEAVREGLLARDAGGFSFLHAEVQEAAYRLVPEGERGALHLGIGRLLAAELPEEAPGESLFEVVNQLNRGLSLLEDPAERSRVCSLNRAAGKKAKETVAYDAARDYLAQACALLPPDPWSSSYEDAVSIRLDLAECAYLTGDFAGAEEGFRELSARARCKRESACVGRLRSRLYRTTGHFAEALSVLLESLALLGVELPGSEQALAASFRIVSGGIAAATMGRPVPSLAEATEGENADAAIVISLLVEGLGPAYAAAPSYFPIFAALAVQYSLRFGPTADSAVAYNSYAIVRVSLRHEIPAAVEFSVMALRLVERMGDARARAIVLVGHAGLVLPWCTPFANCTPLLERGFRELLHSGDFFNCAYVAPLLVWGVLEQGAPLDEVVRTARHYQKVARQTHNEPVCQTLRLVEQMAACLQGRTRHPSSLEDDSFNEAECCAAFSAAAWHAGLAYYHVMKLVCACIYGSHQEALDAAQRAEPLLRLMRAMPVAGTLSYYRALALAALISPPETPPGTGEAQGGADPGCREMAQKLREIEQSLRRLAADCPENFQSRHALVAAELARIEGRELDAERLYEEAVLSAQRNGLLQQKGVACEAAAHFQRGRGLHRFAQNYLREARTCFERWGAHGKVAQLEGMYPWLKDEGHRATPAALISQLNAITVVRATQALSAEMELEQLAETLMRIVMEHAGAQRGCLFLRRGETLSLEVRSALEKSTVLFDRERPQAEEIMPVSVLNYVRRARTNVILDAPHEHTPFSADSYFQSHSPQSLLCLPVLRQAKLVGILYLENDLTRGAFTEERVALLEALTGQAAGALENARVYQELKESEQRYRQLTETLEQHVAEAVQELAEKNTLLVVQSRQAVMGETISNIAHNWRQPLNLLGLLAQEQQMMLRLGGASGVRIEENVDKMMEILEQMSRTIDDFRFFFSPSTEKVSFRLQEVVQKTLSLLEGAFEAYDIEARLECGGDRELYGYRNDFSQVILNILINAKDAFVSRDIPRQRKIVVRTETKGGRAAVTISDNAGGIAEGMIDKVFEPYFTTKGPAHGTGIGLYMAKTIIEKNMNGVLSVRNVEGGAEFRVEV